jgi:alkylation response protein AidB-like acyl-CoA dehydrogenase
LLTTIFLGFWAHPSRLFLARVRVRCGAQLFAAEHCNKVVTDAVQIFGGAGFNTECVWRPKAHHRRAHDWRTEARN